MSLHHGYNGKCLQKATRMMLGFYMHACIINNICHRARQMLLTGMQG